MPRAAARERRLARIRATVRDIPRGAVASYGQIAAIAGVPRGARQVGYALRHMPAGEDLPWHRVITAAGRIAFAEHSDSWRRQAARLRAEGVEVCNGRIDLRRYRWQPDLDELLWKPSAAWDES
ncbi:MAG TPA: MGMT family protein [Woeseiaceae bacterium]|nr:MGMT family protein [Woeseiaceae bacterium]